MTQKSATVQITNETGGNAEIILFHNNSTNGTQYATFNAEPGQTVGSLTVYFETGIDYQFVNDYWSVLVNVQGGSSPGFYVNSTPFAGLYPYWKENQLTHTDAGETLTFTVSTSTFGVNLKSEAETDSMTRLTNVAAPITNVFVLMLENHSFDNMFAFSGIPGLKVATTSDFNTYDGTNYYVSENAPVSMPTDPGHEFPDIVQQLCGAGVKYSPGQYPPINMSGFASTYATSTSEGPAPPSQDIGDIMACFNLPAELPLIYGLASMGVVCDQWQSSLPGPTWPNRFFLHGGSSSGLDTSPTTAQMVEWDTVDGFQYVNGSIYQALENARIQYRFYNDAGPDDLSLYSDNPSAGNVSGAIPQVASLKGVSLTDINSLDHFASDLMGPYPYSYTFIEPHYGDVSGGTYVGGSSHHPMDDTAGVDLLVFEVYAAIFNSPYAKSSLLIVLYDEHGGFYDSVPPTEATPPGDGNPYGYNTYGFTFNQYGVRVPAMVFSPLLSQTGVDSTPYDHTSVLKTLEKLFGLSSLTQRDANANDLTSLLSSNAVVADVVKTLVPPKPAATAAVATKPPRTAEEQAQIDAQPLPDRGNLHGVVMTMSKADYELSPQTPADLAAIKAKVAAIKTRGDAHAYIVSVMEKVTAARAAKKPTSPPPPATPAQ